MSGENSKANQPGQSKLILGISIMGWFLIILCLSCLVLVWTFFTVRNAHKIEFHRGFLSQMDVFVEDVDGDGDIGEFFNSMLDDLKVCADYNEVKYSFENPSFKYDTQLLNSQGARTFNVCMKEKLEDLAPVMENKVYSRLVKALD